MEETEDEVLEIGEGRRDSWLIEKYGSTQGFPDGTVGKESACQCRRCKPGRSCRRDSNSREMLRA